MRFIYAAPLVVLLGAFGSSPSVETFGGRAFAAFVNAPSLGTSGLYLVDSGELSSGGGWEAAGQLGATVPGVLTAEVLNAATTGHDDVAASSASLANVTVLPGHAAQVTASFVLAEAWATATGTQGFTQVYDLTFAGVPIQVTGVPNQRVAIPGLLGPLATLIINEQKADADGITTNALHLSLATGEEIILGSARSVAAGGGDVIVAEQRTPDYQPEIPATARASAKPAMAAAHSASDSDGCGQTGRPNVIGDLLQALGLRPAVLEAHDCFDFVTWGLFFFGSSDGPGRINSGGNAGYKNFPNTPLRVNLNLVDHNRGRHISLKEPTTPDAYRPGTFFGDPCHCRQFNARGTQTVDGTTSDIVALVEVCDFGEPGNEPKGVDAFMIGGGGYFAEANPIIGGNAQLHKTKQCPAEGCADLP